MPVPHSKIVSADHANYDQAGNLLRAVSADCLKNADEPSRGMLAEALLRSLILGLIS